MARQDFLALITEKVLYEPPNYIRLVIVMEGRGKVQFIHAITIRRKELLKNKKKLPNLWLLDFIN